MYLMADSSVDTSLYDHGQETSDRHVTGLLWPQSLVHACRAVFITINNTHCMHVRIATILNEYTKIILKGCESWYRLARCFVSLKISINY